MIKEAGILVVLSGMYLSAICPRRSGCAEKMKGVFYAHRGLHNKKEGVPENTLTAFRKAVEAGYGIELDLQLTKDNEVVVFHDFSLKRLCGVEGDVSDYTYKELQQFPILGTNERIPRFSSVLKLVDQKVPLLVELKYKKFGSRICERADQLLRGYKGEYVIESFHPIALYWYRRHRPDVCRGQLSMNFQKQEGTYTIPHWLARHLLYNFISRPDFIAYDLRAGKAVSKNICRKLFQAPSAAWTVKSDKQLETARLYYDSFIFEGFIPNNP